MVVVPPKSRWGSCILHLEKRSGEGVSVCKHILTMIRAKLYIITQYTHHNIDAKETKQGKVQLEYWVLGIVIKNRSQA
jgi:hypothetical protein